MSGIDDLARIGLVLLKKSDKLGRWNPRWVTLHDGETIAGSYLSFKSSVYDTTPRKIIYLKDIATCRIAAENYHWKSEYNGCCIFLETFQNKKCAEYFLAASNPLEAKTWVTQIREMVAAAVESALVPAGGAGPTTPTKALPATPLSPPTPTRSAPTPDRDVAPPPRDIGGGEAGAQERGGEGEAPALKAVGSLRSRAGSHEDRVHTPTIGTMAPGARDSHFTPPPSTLERTASTGSASASRSSSSLSDSQHSQVMEMSAMMKEALKGRDEMIAGLHLQLEEVRAEASTALLEAREAREEAAAAREETEVTHARCQVALQEAATAKEERDQAIDQAVSARQVADEARREAEATIAGLEEQLGAAKQELQAERSRTKEVQDALLWDTQYNQEQKERSESALAEVQSALASAEQEYRARSEQGSAASSQSGTRSFLHSGEHGTPGGTPLGTPLRARDLLEDMQLLWFGCPSGGGPAQPSTPPAAQRPRGHGPVPSTC